ncbi:hypothetical protein [Ferruginibacter sp.]
MPIYPPRSAPVKKKEELQKRFTELACAIKKNDAADKLFKLAEKYRQSQLSFLKAKVHLLKETELQHKQSNIKFENLEENVKEWEEKTNDAIIEEVKISKEF